MAGPAAAGPGPAGSGPAGPGPAGSAVPAAAPDSEPPDLAAPAAQAESQQPSTAPVAAVPGRPRAKRRRRRRRPRLPARPRGRRPIVRWLTLAAAALAIALGAWWGVGVITDGEVGYVPGGDTSGPPSARSAPESASSDVLRSGDWLLATYRLTNNGTDMSVSGTGYEPGHRAGQRYLTTVGVPGRRHLARVGRHHRDGRSRRGQRERDDDR